MQTRTSGLHSVVVIDKENTLAIIAPLSDMMRTINCDYSGYSWHSVILNHIIKKVNQKRKNGLKIVVDRYVLHCFHLKFSFRSVIIRINQNIGRGLSRNTDNFQEKYKMKKLVRNLLLFPTLFTSVFSGYGKIMVAVGLLKKALRAISRAHYFLIIAGFVPVLGVFQQPRCVPIFPFVHRSLIANV
jgi:hypothetical protein